jgi:hypothetical protein
MVTAKPSLPSGLATIGQFNADEIRRLVRVGKARGLVHHAGEALAVEKNGKPAAALGGVRSQWMDVTPELAARWLENNFRNRSIDDDVVAAYARDMVNGVWVPTHQGVAFNDCDELIDGQHRLRAVVLSGKTIRMMVTFGLPSAIAGKEMTTMDAIDRGRTRSVADQLKIQHGLANGSVIAAATASVARLCCDQRTKRLSVGQTLEIFRAFEQPIVFVIQHRSKVWGLRQAGLLAAFAFAGMTEEGFGAGMSPLAKMYLALLAGDGLCERSALARLRTFLTSDEAKLLNRGTDRGIAELVLQAVLLEQRGKLVEKLTLAQDGANHFRTLQPARVTKIAEMFALPKRGAA